MTLTPEEIHELAQAALVSRFQRMVVVGHTPKGRVIAEFPEPMPECERAWFAIVRPPHVWEA